MGHINFSREYSIHPYKHGLMLKAPNSGQLEMNHSINQVLNLPLNVYFLNKHSEVIEINDQTIHSDLGWHSRNHALGKSVKAIWPQIQAMKILQNDRTVIENAKPIVKSEVYEGKDFLKKSLSFKLPWYDQHAEIVGLVGFSILDSSALPLDEALTKLLQTGLLQYKKSHVEVQSKYKLTKQQKKVTALIIRGQTSTQIANHLYLSKRTVEHYIEHIKHLLGVHKKSDIINLYHSDLEFKLIFSKDD